MDTLSKPTFVLSGHRLLFDNMLSCPHLALFDSLSLCMPYLSLCHLLCLSPTFSFLCHCIYTLEVRKFGARALPPWCKKKGQGCKQEDANPKREMFSRLGGLATPSGSLSLSLLAFFLESCIRIPSPCILYLSYTLLGPHFLGMAYVYFTFSSPCWAIPFECWQRLLYFPALSDTIVHDVCVCPCVGDHALCMMDSHG